MRGRRHRLRYVTDECGSPPAGQSSPKPEPGILGGLNQKRRLAAF